MSEGGHLYRRQASVENPLFGSQPPPPTGNMPAPTPSSHCWTAVNFLSMVTYSAHESLGFANCNPQNTLGDGVFHAHITDREAEAQGGQRPAHGHTATWGQIYHSDPGVLNGLIGKGSRAQMQR